MYYSNKLEVTSNRSIFENDKKTELSTLEKIGLETVLDEFVQELNEELGLEKTDWSIKNYTRYNKDNVDILDGYHDTFIFEDYAFSCIWTTKNGCIMLEAIDLDSPVSEDLEEFEKYKGDRWSIITHFDIYSDFETVLFRLN